MLTSDKIYSNDIQETEAETVILEKAEEIFKKHLANKEPNQAEEDLRDSIRVGTTSSTDKVGFFGHLFDSKNNTKENQRFFSWFNFSS